MPEKFKFSIEDGRLVIAVDMNEDGQALVRIELDLAEALDEFGALFKKDEA